MRLLVLLMLQLLHRAGAAELSGSLLGLEFPHGTAAQPTLRLGGRLWADLEPIIVGDGCVAAASGPTVNGTGHDQWGGYSFVQTPYVGCGISFEARVHMYDDLPVATFTTRLPTGGLHLALSNTTDSPALAPIVAFPSLPFAAPMQSTRTFSWAGGQLGFRSAEQVDRAAFHGQTGNVPSPSFFVDSYNATLVVGPLDHFHGWACTETHPKPSHVEGWGCGIMNTVPELPPGFASTTVLFGGIGVTDTMAAWGSAMRRYYNTTRRSDLQTTMLGVYTDNGAFYNNPQNLLGATAPTVFGEMFDGFRKDGVPAKYLMLDDWWYTGIHPGSMLIDTPVANPEWFPNGLTELFERVQVPLDIYSVHYTQNFTLFNTEAGVIPTIHDNWAPPGGFLPGPGIKPSRTFYELLFEAWGADRGMAQMYEIDFLVFLDYQTPSFQADPEGARWFLEGMNDAALAKNVTIQYCSATAIDAMQSLRFPAVTNIRASTDYACFVNYQVGPGYLISWALGLRPSKDVLWTTEVQPTLTKPPGAGCGGNIKGCSMCGGNFSRAQHYTAELDMVLALFSTGPVGLGDGLNYTNATRAKATCTADGTLLQPDKALTPLDWSLFAGSSSVEQIRFGCADHTPYPCTPQLLQTHTTIRDAVGGLDADFSSSATGAAETSGLQWHHIVAVAVKSYALSLEDLWPALPQPAGWSYVVIRRSVLAHGCVDGKDAFGPRGCATTTECSSEGGGVCLPTIDTRVGFWDEANLHIAWAQYMLAPRSEHGWCLLGELDKYNPIARARLRHGVSYTGEGITVSVSGVQGEPVTLYAITPANKVAARTVEVGANGTAQVIFD